MSKIYPISSVLHQKSTPPWWTKALPKAILKKRSLNYYSYASQCNLVKAKVHSAQITYKEKLVKMFKTNSKVLYAYLRSKQKVKDTISHLQLVKEDGFVMENNDDIATTLGQFIETTFNEETLDHIPELPDECAFVIAVNYEVFESVSQCC